MSEINVSEIQKLLNVGKFQEGLKYIENLEKNDNISPEDQINLDIFKGHFKNKLELFTEAIEIAQNIKKKTVEMGDLLHTFDANLIINEAKYRNGTLEKKTKTIIENEELLGKMLLKYPKKGSIREGIHVSMISNLQYQNGELEVGLKTANRAYEIIKLYGNRQEKAEILNKIGVLYSENGKLTKGLGFFKQALNHYEKLGDKDGISK